MSTYTKPDAAAFKDYFDRDFPYGADINTSVRDKDITRAFADTDTFFNEDLAADQPSYTLYYLLLSAHFLVVNLRNSSQGIAGAYSFLSSSKGAGAVSEGIAIPQRVQDNPELSMLAKTNYGAKFLQLVLPQLVGQVFTVCGATKP